MWVIVFFDLPTETKLQRKQYASFRKNLILFGFSMFQYSIYVRPCASLENAQMNTKRIKSILPEKGKVCVMTITDRQFGNIVVYEGYKAVPACPAPVQLELF